jgi:hypothetical protein
VKKIINWNYLPFIGFGIGDSAVAGIYSGLQALGFEQTPDRYNRKLRKENFREF